MPIYEYRCKICGKEFEVMQKITEEPLNACIKCNGELERLISPTTFILKGSGWYATDYGTFKKSEEDKSSASEKKNETNISQKDTKGNKNPPLPPFGKGGMGGFSEEKKKKDTDKSEKP